MFSSITPRLVVTCRAGRGCFCFGDNSFRLVKVPPTRHKATLIAFIAILWGALDQARYMLALPSELSFALLLVVSGLTVLLSPLLTRPRLRNANRAGDV